MRCVVNRKQARRYFNNNLDINNHVICVKQNIIQKNPAAERRLLPTGDENALINWQDPHPFHAKFNLQESLSCSLRLLQALLPMARRKVKVLKIGLITKSLSLYFPY